MEASKDHRGGRCGSDRLERGAAQDHARVRGAAAGAVAGGAPPAIRSRAGRTRAAGGGDDGARDGRARVPGPRPGRGAPTLAVRRALWRRPRGASGRDRHARGRWLVGGRVRLAATHAEELHGLAPRPALGPGARRPAGPSAHGLRGPRGVPGDVAMLDLTPHAGACLSSPVTRGATELRPCVFAGGLPLAYEARSARDARSPRQQKEDVWRRSQYSPNGARERGSGSSRSS